MALVFEESYIRSLLWKMIQQAEPSERGWAISFFVKKKNMGFNFIRQIIWALTREPGHYSLLFLAVNRSIPNDN